MINKIFIDSVGDISIHSTEEDPELWLFLSDETEPRAHVGSTFHDVTNADVIQVSADELRMALRLLYKAKRESL